MLDMLLSAAGVTGVDCACPIFPDQAPMEAQIGFGS